jgi:lysozyme
MIDLLSGFSILRLLYSTVVATLLVFYPHFVSNGHYAFVINMSPTAGPQEFYQYGIDISKHNGTINWEKINMDRKEDKKLNFVIIKATEGINHIDSKFYENWDGAKKVGLITGAYHFFNNNIDPHLQARNFLSTVSLESGDLAPVLDFEVPVKNRRQREKVISNVKIWLETVEKHIGVRPIVYTNKSLFNSYFENNLSDYPIWLSDYFSKDLKRFPEENLILWQFTDKGKVLGVEGFVDMNVFMGTPHRFQRFIL